MNVTKCNIKVDLTSLYSKPYN